MKKFMKLAAIAAAMLSLCVACEKDEELSIEGKQWIVSYEGLDGGNTQGVIDLGYTEKGKISFGVLNQETNQWEETGYIDMGMSYTIEETGTGAGIISYTYTYLETEWVERIVYSDLKTDTVKFGQYTFINEEGEEDDTESTMFWGIKYDEPAKVSETPITINLLQ